MSAASSINGNLAVRACADAGALSWTESPSGSVWRKRFHLVGPAESGQVTSLVRYLPDSQFPAHDHPGGEEILVLEGVFSDEQGDWPAGSYLLNPEGFRHAPHSTPGCELLVKLRQYPGTDRLHVAMNVHMLSWQPTGRPGESEKHLYSQTGFDDTMRLLRWDPGASPGELEHAGGVELYVMNGAFEDERGEYPEGSWLRIPPGQACNPHSRRGCVLYCKTGGFRYLQAAD